MRNLKRKWPHLQGDGACAIAVCFFSFGQLDYRTSIHNCEMNIGRWPAIFSQMCLHYAAIEDPTRWPVVLWKGSINNTKFPWDMFIFQWERYLVFSGKRDSEIWGLSHLIKNVLRTSWLAGPPPGAGILIPRWAARWRHCHSLSSSWHSLSSSSPPPFFLSLLSYPIPFSCLHELNSNILRKNIIKIVDPFCCAAI